MRCTVPRWGGLVIVVLAAILGACSSRAAAPVARTGRASQPVAAEGHPRPYLLLTHCGIDEARIGGRYFEAVHPLSDGQGNPPLGWGNPFQKGTITFMSATEALFQDDQGHHVLFRLRPGATAFKQLCS